MIDDIIKIMNAVPVNVWYILVTGISVSLILAVWKLKTVDYSKDEKGNPHLEVTAKSVMEPDDTKVLPPPVKTGEVSDKPTPPAI